MASITNDKPLKGKRLAAMLAKARLSSSMMAVMMMNNDS